MNKDVNIYSFNDECYVYLGDYRKLQQENEKLKEDIKHLVNIINNNCLELTTTEEEFESLKRWNNE